MASTARGDNFREKFMDAMRSRFVKIDEYAECIALALVCKRNMIAFGPGGFAKSEGIEFALSLVQEKPDEMFVQSCGEGMTEERLFGGVDLKALDDEQILQYHAERSFLVARYAVFEEGLDMPDAAIMSLRDTLTKKALRNGRQFVQLHTESLFILTNAEPKQKATLGASYKALLERFPLQLRVAWDSHTADDYAAMLDAVDGRGDVGEPGSLAADLREAQRIYGTIKTDGAKRTLAGLLERAGRVGEPVSGRTAVMAEQIIKASVAMRGGDRVETRDLFALRFLPAIGSLDHLLKDIRDALAKEEAERVANELYDQRTQLLEELKNAKGIDEILAAQAKLIACDAKVKKLGLSEAIVQRHKAAEAKKAAAADKPATADKGFLPPGFIE